MSPAELDILRENMYKYLFDNQHIACEFDTFQEGVDVYKTPHGVYIDIMQGASQETQDQLINQLLNISAKDIKNYKNTADYWVQQHELVRYIEELDAYILFNDSIIQYTD